jgi:hypothetical protein
VLRRPCDEPRQTGAHWSGRLGGPFQAKVANANRPLCQRFLYMSRASKFEGVLPTFVTNGWLERSRVLRSGQRMLRGCAGIVCRADGADHVVPLVSTLVVHAVRVVPQFAAAAPMSWLAASPGASVCAR